MLIGKGNLACLSIGQIVQVKGCLGANFIGMLDIFLIFTNGTCPNLLCHICSMQVLGKEEQIEGKVQDSVVLLTE